jgi:hypothetical protein
MAHDVELLLCKHEALSSNSSPTKKKKKERKEKKPVEIILRGKER